MERHLSNLILSCLLYCGAHPQRYITTQLRRLTQGEHITTTILDIQSQSHVTTDGRPVSMSWCKVHSGTCDQILFSV
jgi:hypothetical protein